MSLEEREQNIARSSSSALEYSAAASAVLLAQLGVNGQHLRVADEGKRQDGDGVRRLK